MFRASRDGQGGIVGHVLTKAREDQLIRCAQRGDADAIEELIRIHQGPLYGFMLRLCRRPELAEDMVQEAFVRVIRHIDRFDPRFRFSTWLFTIARRLWANHNQKMRPEFDSEAAERWLASEPMPEELMAEREGRDHLRKILDVAVSCLSPIQREVVTLFHHHAWTVEALAEHLSLPVGTIKSHLHRARKRMHQEITKDEAMAKRAEEVLR
jgi:RNA polymerase sigma-70 factor (ECF subfamily)